MARMTVQGGGRERSPGGEHESATAALHSGAEAKRVPVAAVDRANVAASMSILVDLVTHSLEPEYAAASLRTAAPGDAARGDVARGDVARGDAASDGAAPGGARRRGRPLRRSIVVVCLAVLGLLLGLGARRQRIDAPTAARAHAKLADQVRAATATVQSLADSAQALQVDSDRLRAAALGTDGAGVASRLGAAQRDSASTAVTGPGLHLTIDDARVAAGAEADPASRVTDRDLQRVVNGLWASGAEAITIGGVRLTARSSIRTAGEAILVDFRPVELPYSIDAVGDPAAMDRAFAASSGAVDMRALAATYGIRFTVARASRLTASAGTDLPLRLATALPTAAVSSAAVSSGTLPPDPAPAPTGGGSSP